MSQPPGGSVAATSQTRSAAMRIILTSPQGSKSMMTTLRFDGTTTAGDLLGLLADQEGLAPTETANFVIRTPEAVLSADAHLRSLSMDTLPYLEHVPRLQRIKITSNESTPVTKTLSLDAVVPLALLMPTIAPEFGLKEDQASLCLLSLVCPHPPIAFNDLQESEVNFLVANGVATLGDAQTGTAALEASPTPSSDSSSTANGGNTPWSISASTLLPTSGTSSSSGGTNGIELDFSQSLFQQGVRSGAHLQIFKRKRSLMHKLLGKRKSLLPTTAKERALAEANAASSQSRVSRGSPTFIAKVITCIHEYFCYHPQKLSSQTSPGGASSGSFSSTSQSVSAPEGLNMSFTVTHPSLFLKDYSQGFLLAYKILLESLASGTGALGEIDHYDDGRALGALLRHCLAVMDPRLLEPIQVELFSLQSVDQFSTSLPHFIQKLNQDERTLFNAWTHLCHELSTMSLACTSDRLATIFAPLFCRAAASDDSALGYSSKSSPATTSPRSARASTTSPSPTQSRNNDSSLSAVGSTFGTSSPRSKMITIIAFMIDNPTLFGESPFSTSLPNPNSANGSPGSNTASVSSGSSHSPTNSSSTKTNSKKSMKKEKSNKSLKKHNNPASPAPLSGPGTPAPNLTGLRNSSEEETPTSARSRSETDDSSAHSQSRGSPQQRSASLVSSPSQPSSTASTSTQKQLQSMNSQSSLGESASSPTSPDHSTGAPIASGANGNATSASGLMSGGGGGGGSGANATSTASSTGLATTSSNTMFMVADFAWSPSMEGDIELHKGDVLQVLVADAQGWYVGKLLNTPNNPVGVFPSTYCSVVSKKDVYTLLKLEETLLFESDDVASSDDSSSSFSTSSLYHHLVAARSGGGYYASSSSATPGATKWPNASPPLQSPSSPTTGPTTVRAGSAFSPAAIAASKAKTAALAGSQEAISPLASPIDVPSSSTSSSSSHDGATTPPHNPAGLPKHLSTSAVLRRSPPKENDPTEIPAPDPSANVNASSPVALALQETRSSAKELMVKSASTGILGGAESEPIVALQPAVILATIIDQYQDSISSSSETTSTSSQRKSQEDMKSGVSSASLSVGLASESVKPIQPSAEATAHRKAYPVPPPKGISSKSLPRFSGSAGQKAETPVSGPDSSKSGAESSPTTLNISPQSSPSSTRELHPEPSNQRRPISRAHTSIVQHQRAHHTTTTSAHSQPPQVQQNPPKSNRTSLPDPITVPLDVSVRPHFQSGLSHLTQGSQHHNGSSPRQYGPNAADGSVGSGSGHHSRISGHSGIPRIPLYESASGPGGWGTASSHSAAHSMRRLSGPRSPRNEYSPNSGSFKNWPGNQGTGSEARASISSTGSARGSPRGGGALDSLRLSAIPGEDELDRRRREVMQLHTTVFALEENNKAMRDTVTEQELAIERLSRELELLKAHSMHMAAQQQQQQGGPSSTLSNSNDSIDAGNNGEGSNGGDSPSGASSSFSPSSSTTASTDHDSIDATLKAHSMRPRKRPSRRISTQDSPTSLSASFPPPGAGATPPAAGAAYSPQQQQHSPHNAQSGVLQPEPQTPSSAATTSLSSAANGGTITTAGGISVTPPAASPATPTSSGPSSAPRETFTIPLTVQLAFLVLALAILLWVVQPMLRN